MQDPKGFDIDQLIMIPADPEQFSESVCPSVRIIFCVKSADRNFCDIVMKFDALKYFGPRTISSHRTVYLKKSL